jgi:nucleotide-binding universal stress UspA family protein
MYRNIMVPVDGSSFSREAMLKGLRLASECGGTLHLVRVATAPMIPASPEGFALASGAAQDQHSAELSALYAMAAECRAHANVTVSAALERGPVVDVLAAYAHRNDVDLIVMRSHARGGLKRVWFGSVADGLIRESGIPVLVVRPPSVATALENGMHLKRILVPLDGSVLAEGALEPAVRLAKIEHASITLLRIVTAWKQTEPGALQSSIGPAGATEVSEAQRYLDSILAWPGTGSLRVTRRVVISGDPAATILQISHDIEADLISIATRGRGALKRATTGSVSDEVMRESDISTMVLHPMDGTLPHATVRAEAQAAGYEASAVIPGAVPA